MVTPIKRLRRALHRCYLPPPPPPWTDDPRGPLHCGICGLAWLPVWEPDLVSLDSASMIDAGGWEWAPVRIER